MIIDKEKIISKSSAPILNQDGNSFNISVEYAIDSLTGKLVYQYKIKEDFFIHDTEDNEIYISKLKYISENENYNIGILNKIYTILKLKLSEKEENNKINLLIMES